MPSVGGATTQIRIWPPGDGSDPICAYHGEMLLAPNSIYYGMFARTRRRHRDNFRLVAKHPACSKTP